MSRKTSQKKKSVSARKKQKKPIVFLLVLAAVGAGVFALVYGDRSPGDAYVLPATPRDPRPKTLPPALFTGKAAHAYRVAWERPELLGRMPCYCGCYVDNGHRNNLDCFVDRHAAS